MPPILDLRRKGTVPPAHFSGDQLILDPCTLPDRLLGQIATWVEMHPLGWLMPHGPAVALVIHLAASRLYLRIAGAALIAPQDWHCPHGFVPLEEPPVPLPTLLFGQDATGQAVSLRERRLARAWGARIAGALPANCALKSPVMQAMMANRMARLGPCPSGRNPSDRTLIWR